MNIQRQTRDTPDSQKIDQKAASRASLQEMFQGSIDPEVVNLILTESDYNVEDTIEKLFTLTSTSPLPESNQSSYKVPSAMNQVFSDSPSPITSGAVAPLLKTPAKSNGVEYGSHKKRQEDWHSPKRLDKSPEDRMSNVSQRLVASADTMFKSCIGSDKENVNGIPFDKSNTIAASKTKDNGKFERKGQNVNDSGYSDSFKAFMKNFNSSDSDSTEWNSVSKINETNQNGLSHSGTQQKSLKISQEESIGGEKDRTSNMNSISNTNKANIDLKDSSKTSGNVDPKDSSSKTSSLETQSLKKDILTTNDLKQHNANALPAWPDTNHFNNFQISQTQTNIPPSHNTSFQQNFQTQNMGFNLVYGPRYQQFQPRTGYFNARPFLNQAFYSAGPRNRPPMQPWQPMGYHGQAAYNPRSAHQMGSRPRFPPGFIRTPHNSMSRSSASKTPFKLPDGKVLVLMRGLPGSGKTTLAQRIKGNGVVLSTDDYFNKNGQYQFDGVNLGEAHEWNQIRAREAMQGGVSPVIIDNTNTQAWEMKPYVSMAKRLDYQVILKEPETYWRWNPRELFRHNQHGVTFSGIKNMIERYEHNITAEHILNSTNVNKKAKGEQGPVSQCESQANPNTSKRSKTESELPDKSFTSTVVEKEKKESKTVPQENSKQNAVAEERGKQDAQCGQQCPDRRIQQQKEQMQKDLSQNKRTTAWSKKTAQQEERAMKSHGSRSPVRDIMFMPEEREEKLVDSTECKAQDEDLELNNLAPKQQRLPRKRERRILQSTQPQEEVGPQNEVEIEEIKPELKSSDVLNDEKEGVAVESGDSSISIEVMSEYGSEDSQCGKQDIQLCDEHCSPQDKWKQGSQCSNEVEQVGNSMEDAYNKQTQSSSDDLGDDVSVKDEVSLFQSDDDIDLDNIAMATLPSSSVDSNNCVQEVGLLEDKDEEKTSHSKSNVAVENVEERSNNDEQVNNIKTIPEDKKMPDDKQKISQESDVESEVDNRDSSSQLSTQSVTDDAYVSDDEESDDVIIESDDDDDNSDALRTSVALIKDESQINSSEDSESELSGFEFLITCFPDIDDKTVFGILSKHHGDVAKAIESILNNSAGLLEETKQKSGLLPYPDSSYSSDNYKDEVPLLPKDASPLTHRSTTIPISQSTFQMTLEPAVAFHLLEMFGPIGGVTFEGDFAASDLSLTVDMEFSKLLYHQWKKSVQKSRGIIYTHKDEQKMSPTSSKRKQRTKLKLQEPLPPPSKVSHKATDLREIMNEQMALEQSRREQEKRDSDNNMAVILKRQKLYAMFPGVDPSALEELFEANTYELAPTVSMVQTSCNLQPKPTALIEDKRTDELEEDWIQFANFADIQEQPVKGYQALQDPEYIDFRAEANTHYKQRDDCFKKAAFAFSRKQGQLAQFYASQGHLHTEKINQANDRAASHILEHKNASNDQFSLDLHGLHVTEALQALEERLNPPDFIHKPKYISVVTGRGLHSKQGRAKIKPAVLDYLQRNNYRHEELHAGLIKVFLK